MQIRSSSIIQKIHAQEVEGFTEQLKSDKFRKEDAKDKELPTSSSRGILFCNF